MNHHVIPGPTANPEIVPEVYSSVLYFNYSAQAIIPDDRSGFRNDSPMLAPPPDRPIGFVFQHNARIRQFVANTV